MPPVSNRTIAMLAEPFQGGDGPSHTTIELVWTAADAIDYLPSRDGNKLERVLGGLRRLRDGVPGFLENFLPADHDKLREVVADLSTRLMAAQLIDPDQLEKSLANDGFSLDGDRLAEVRPEDEPADRLATFLDDLFGERGEFAIARNHFRQAGNAFDRQDWEAANAQFRSALDATYDALAAQKGAPANRTGGAARRWLADNGFLEEDESELLKAFASFAGSAGSHAGMSDAAECQLRRHFVTALMVFGMTKLG
jgi:hypothetical protein